jgi:hypothetical protein
MPKCAGKSTLNVLERHVSDRLILDYASYFKIPEPERSGRVLESLKNPISVPAGKVVFGHFFPVKYLGHSSIVHPDFRMVTILRDPITRLHSHYKFWNSRDFRDHFIWRKMKQENWQFEDFAFSEEMRNIYAQYGLCESLERFTYIGLFENLDCSIAKCMDELGIGNTGDLTVPILNQNQNPAEINLSANMLRKLRAFHSEDYKVYEYAKSAFNH